MGLRGLRTTWGAILRTAIAAGAAWLLVHSVLGHSPGIFAPITAIVAIGIAAGHQTRRTVEIVIGAAVGVAVGDLLIAAIGSGRRPGCRVGPLPRIRHPQRPGAGP